MSLEEREMRYHQEFTCNLAALLTCSATQLGESLRGSCSELLRRSELTDPALIPLSDIELERLVGALVEYIVQHPEHCDLSDIEFDSVKPILGRKTSASHFAHFSHAQLLVESLLRCNETKKVEDFQMYVVALLISYRWSQDEESLMRLTWVERGVALGEAVLEKTENLESPLPMARLFVNVLANMDSPAECISTVTT